MILLTNYTLISGSSKISQFLLAYMRVRCGLLPPLRQGREMDNPLHNWLLAVLKRILGVRDTTPSWCVVRECGLEPLQFNWFHVAMRLYNSLTQCNSSTMRKVLQADMQLSCKSPECRSSHIHSAMEGLTQSYMLNKSCWTVSLIISVGLSWTSGTDV